MSDGRREWARGQLIKEGVPEDIIDTALQMLSVFWSQTFADVKVEQTFLEMVTKLAQGFPLVAEEPDAVWVPARPGTLVVRDRVRVRPDAYTGEAGVAHNGKEGVIVAIRYGDIHVLYDDTNATTRHASQSLEKRVN